MFVSLNWLRDFVDLPKDLDTEELGKLLTVRSAEVETVVDQGKAYDGVVIGEILEIEKHPDADKLNVAQVDIGKKKPLQLVFGDMAKQKVGNRLPVAVAPCKLPTGLEIEPKKLRGVKTGGMLCLDQELGLKEDGVSITYFPDVKPGTPLAKAMDLDDTIIEFDNKTLTHRPDLWGHIGIAREIAAITGSDFKIPPAKPKVPKTGDEPNIQVNNPELCPRYMGVIIRGIKVEESPDWLKKRLLATDHSVISNIVDVTNYVLEEVGQPMHAFDLRMIEGGIIVRTANKNEKITTLDGEEKALEENMLLIADKKKAIAVAGVMGGEYSGIQDDTVDILLESANFDAISVRRTSTKIGLRTDSVQRFEKSLDPNQCEHALLRAIELILEICPGAKVGAIVDAACFDESELLIPVNVQRIQRKIGLDIPAPEMANYLNRLNFEVQGKVEESTQDFTVKIPSFRATKDVDIEDDIVEEVARMYGYENIPAVVPELPAKAPAYNAERRHKHDAREIFAHALGYTESYNYSFYSLKTMALYGLDEDTHIKLANYLSEDQSHLRTTLTPNLVRSLREAVKHEQNPALFELGRTYTEFGEFMPKEEKRIGAAREFSKKEKNPFAHIKGDLEQFLDQFGITGTLEFKCDENPPSAVHPYQNAKVIFRGKAIGNVFTLHPYVAEQEDFDGKVAAFELDFATISEARKTEQTYQAESKFPKVEFDISMLLDKKVSAAEIEKVIKKSLGKELRKVELFDSYEGDKIEKDKKSLAYRLTLQSFDRTLTSEDLEKSQKATWAALEKLGATIRGK